MALSDLDIQDDYRSDFCDIVQDFYIPCLSESRVYSRAVGFFSSTSIIAVAKGLTALIRSGGRMRLIASPCLSKEDINAIAIGIKKREVIINIAIQRELEQEFETVAKDRLACLAWLLGQGVLEIKLAISKNLHRQGIYHKKLGIFTDADNNAVAFTGSANESSSALLYNFECLDVFCSWKSAEEERVWRKVAYFEKLWNNQTAKVEVIDFPEAATRSLLKYRPDFPPNYEGEDKIILNQEKPVHTAKRVAETGGSYQADSQSSQKISKPFLKVELRPRQVDALTALRATNYRGILAMATGAGKTITALGCAVELENLDIIFIVAPTNEIVLQWVKEIEQRTSFNLPLVATGKAELWLEPLFRKLRLFHHQKLNRERLPIIVIGSYGELAKSRLDKLITDAGGLPEESLLIADEVHSAGAEGYRRILKDDFRYRLGLSATPIRAYDEEGTDYVLDYFGDIVYEFTLEDAIATNILCQYNYHVYVTPLTVEENERFKNLTRKMGVLLNSRDAEDREQAKLIAIQRSKIVKAAASKLTILDQILQDFPPQRAMIYCADISQANYISSRLAHQGLRVARYTSLEKNRQQILSQFAKGYLDALVAIKCLDEGVDIPAANQAIILASDTSERQFIQRRGRILRAAPNKDVATLIDILVVPPLEDGQVKVIQSEIKRVVTFARTARNRATTIVKLVKEISDYGIAAADLM